HNEFDFADPAFAKLDVVFEAVDGAHGPKRTSVPVIPYLLTQAAQGQQSIEVEILAVDEGASQGLQLFDLATRVAAFKCLDRDISCLEPCVTFPFTALRHQIIF